MDFKTESGKEITFDLTKMTYGQYKGLFDPKEPDKKSDATIANVCGITVEELNAMSFPEQRRLMMAFFKKCREPLKDPNSESASS